jgi:hypothetical protein
MAASVTVTPASGSISAKKTVCKFAIAGTEANDVDEYSTAIYPTMPEHRFVLTMVVGGVEVGRSQVFGTTPDGAYQFNNYIFPVAGTYTVGVYDVTIPTNEIAIQTAATVVVA